MRPLLALALLVGVTTAAPVPKAIKKQADADVLVGRWIAADPTSHSFEFKDDGVMRIWNGPDPGKGAAQYRWTVDDTASPKRMTWLNAGGNPPRPQYECVYELDGDSLKIAYESAPNVPKGVGVGGQNHRMTREQSK